MAGHGHRPRNRPSDPQWDHPPPTRRQPDHNQEWAKGGATEPGNLAPFCRHDHVIKHKGWKTRQVRPGVYQLTSPLGHTYTTGPDPP
jgi:hypothetical protein